MWPVFNIPVCEWDYNKYNKPFLTVVLTLICIIYWLIVRVIPQSTAAYMFIYGVFMVMRVRTLALVLSEKC